VKEGPPDIPDCRIRYEDRVVCRVELQTLVVVGQSKLQVIRTEETI